MPVGMRCRRVPDTGTAMSIVEMCPPLPYPRLNPFPPFLCLFATFCGHNPLQ